MKIVNNVKIYEVRDRIEVEVMSHYGGEHYNQLMECFKASDEESSFINIQPQDTLESFLTRDMDYTTYDGVKCETVHREGWWTDILVLGHCESFPHHWTGEPFPGPKVLKLIARMGTTTKSESGELVFNIEPNDSICQSNPYGPFAIKDV